MVIVRLSRNNNMRGQNPSSGLAQSIRDGILDNADAFALRWILGLLCGSPPPPSLPRRAIT
jgi:hypothetical protein